MKRFAAAGIFSIAAMFAANAQAVGCMSGAAVGGVGGHFAGHHALLGAAGGCAIGHHMAKKRQRQAAANARQQQVAPAPAQ